MSVLSAPYFHDEAAAFGFLEEALWPQGPVCLGDLQTICQGTKA